MPKKQKIVIEEPAVVVEAAVDPVPEPEPKKRGRKAKDEPTAATEPVPVESEPAPKSPKRKHPSSDATLHDAFEHYLVGLESAGKSNGTILSYRLELALAEKELGAEAKIADLDPATVAVFFGSDRVTRTRSGRGKSPLTIDKTRRVVRQALEWAEANGLVAKAPLPEMAATH